MTSAAARERGVRRALSLGGAVGPLLFGGVAVVCGALWRGYDHATQTMSALGARRVRDRAIRAPSRVVGRPRRKQR